MKEGQIDAASVNDSDCAKRSEYDMKNESVVEKRHDIAWKVPWKYSYKIGICEYTLYD